jgi:predicted kinase
MANRGGESGAFATSVIELAKPLPKPRASPVLVMLAGPPGVGKTTLAAALRARTPIAVIESDAVRRAMFARPRHDGEENGAVFAAIHEALRRLLGDGISTLVDATNMVEKERAVMYDIADDAGAQTIIVRVTAPAPVVRQRLEAGASRGASEAGVAEFEKMRRRWRPISREHFVVNTVRSTQSAVEAIAREIEVR